MIDFEGQRKDEKVEFVFRRHAITMRNGVFFAIIMLILGLLPFFIWQAATWTVFAWMGFGLVGFLGYAYTYLLWHFSYYLVTNERIRQVRQKSLFKKTVVDLSLNKIHNISFDVPGILANIFSYGTLLVQTELGDLVISSVKNPNKVYNELQNVIHEAEKGNK